LKSSQQDGGGQVLLQLSGASLFNEGLSMDTTFSQIHPDGTVPLTLFYLTAGMLAGED
jgi:hypothetical protein